MSQSQLDIRNTKDLLALAHCMLNILTKIIRRNNNMHDMLVLSRLSSTDLRFTVLGHNIAVSKTHIDLVSGFRGRRRVAAPQVTLQKAQLPLLRGSSLPTLAITVSTATPAALFAFSEWAHIVNASVLAGEGIVKAIAHTAASEGFPVQGDRGLLVLADD